jgi:hypothetical protein
MGRSLAVIFGVNEYIAAKGFRSLRYCASDSVLLRDTLTRSLSSVEVVAHERGSVRAGDLDAALALLQEQCPQDDDQVIFFFAGHGFTQRGDDYLGFTDSAPRDATTCRSVTDIQRRLRAMGAGKILLILDCCREIIDRGDHDIEEFRGVATQDAKLDAVLFLGCRIAETSQEHPQIGDEGHGVFTAALCHALGEAPELPLQRLESEVQGHALLLTKQHGLRPQHPQVVGPFAFAVLDIFGRPAEAPVATLRRRPRMILITGPTQAGKTTVGRRLQELAGFRHIEMSGYVARRYREFVAQTSDTGSIQDFVEGTLWVRHGDDVISRDVLTDLGSTADDVIVTGARNPAEVEALRAARWDVLQIYLHSNAQLRWRRAVDSTDDYQNQRYEAFIHRNLREFGWGLARTGTMAGARIVVNERTELFGVESVLREMHAHGWADTELDLANGQQRSVDLREGTRQDI